MDVANRSYRKWARWGAGLAVCGTLLMGAPALAAVPTQLTEQGRLLTSAGKPVTGQTKLTFTIYDAATGGAILWQGQVTVTPDSSGFYSTTLGSASNPINSTVLKGGGAWVGVAVNGGQEMTPRYALNSVPFAIVAGKANSVADGSITTSALAPNFSVSAGQVAGVSWSNVVNVPANLNDLGSLSCTSGQMAVFDGTNWKCADTAVDWSNVKNVPAGLTAASKGSLGGLSCAKGQVAVFDGAKWGCAPQYTDAMAVAAMGAKANTNPLNHDRYTNAEAVKAMGAKANTNPLNHDRYTDAEAVKAMGAKANTNPLNHDRYTDQEAAVAAGGNLVPQWQMEATNLWSDPPERVVETLPGGRVGYVHRSVENGTQCYNWAVSAKFKINPDKAYLFSIWIKATETDLSNYFGFYAYDANGKLIGGPWGNPYFKTNNNDPNYWRRWSGYVLPTFAPDSNNDGIPNTQSATTLGTDWRWPPNAVTAQVRFGSCYGNGSNTGVAFFALPSVREVSATGGYSDQFEPANLQGGWQNYAGGWPAASYYRDANGYVHLRGLVRSGPHGAIFTLPGGYRPAANRMFVVWTNGGAARVDVYPNGVVDWAEGGSNGYFSLDGISFKAWQ